ncbi:sirohydrochlorin chelatase [Microbacterium sp. MAHUQ-60]|uniref:sirohydrochlorin chelatase n=1 Tax=unclassified Microbacterium TaxID=2609290 RepID=UPI0036213B4B
MTTLIACSHGTNSPEGRATVTRLIGLVRDRMPGVRIVPAFVDVQSPRIAAVVARESRNDRAVVVPLLLSSGHHTSVDIASAVAAHPASRQTEPLGTHPLIAHVLATRLRAAVRGAWRPGDSVVLAAAGSSDPLAAQDVTAAAEHLRRLVPAPVTVGYASGAGPRVAEAVSASRRRGATRVIAASHMLAPGFFTGLVRRAGADVVSAPLGADPRVAEVIMDRYQRAL